MRIASVLAVPAAIFLCFICYQQPAEVTSASLSQPSWSYTGNTGPDKWPELYAHSCSGRKQSPIDIVTAKSVYDASLEAFVLKEPSYSGLKYTLANDGHKVTLSFNNALANLSFGRAGRECFRPQHIHWHWDSDSSLGSEHWIDGRTFPLEGHIVMWDCLNWKTFDEAFSAIDGLAVLGLLYQIDNTSNNLGALASKFNESGVVSCVKCADELYKNNGTEIQAFSIYELLPKDTTQYYMYSGSLTTPDCRENVLWTVFRTKIPISTKVMNQFRGIQTLVDKSGKLAPMAGNFRPPLPLNPSLPQGATRQVSRSFPDATLGVSATLSGHRHAFQLVAAALPLLLAGIV